MFTDPDEVFTSVIKSQCMCLLEGQTALVTCTILNIREALYVDGKERTVSSVLYSGTAIPRAYSECQKG